MDISNATAIPNSTQLSQIQHSYPKFHSVIPNSTQLSQNQHSYPKFHSVIPNSTQLSQNQYSYPKFNNKEKLRRVKLPYKGKSIVEYCSGARLNSLRDLQAILCIISAESFEQFVLQFISV